MPLKFSKCKQGHSNLGAGWTDTVFLLHITLPSASKASPTWEQGGLTVFTLCTFFSQCKQGQPNLGAGWTVTVFLLHITFPSASRASPTWEQGGLSLIKTFCTLTFLLVMHQRSDQHGSRVAWPGFICTAHARLQPPV